MFSQIIDPLPTGHGRGPTDSIQRPETSVLRLTVCPVWANGFVSSDRSSLPYDALFQTYPARHILFEIFTWQIPQCHNTSNQYFIINATQSNSYNARTHTRNKHMQQSNKQCSWHSTKHDNIRTNIHTGFHAPWEWRHKPKSLETSMLRWLVQRL